VVELVRNYADESEVMAEGLELLEGQEQGINRGFP
jgi:hypothetical protein